MPKRTDIKTILVIGAGPILIGQACEFDYSGTQGVKALKQEGYRVVLVNSNPATIMTDPNLADATYIEPITSEIVARIIEKERPDAILPTLGGQTALNTALALHRDGVLEKFGVEMIGASIEAIRKAEDRDLFRQAMAKIGLETPHSRVVTNLKQAFAAAKALGYPLILRPAFTLGGTGGGIARNEKEYRELVARGLAASPVSQILVEESVLGWKEFELEVVRDHKDNVVIVCSIENLDPMGVHTGDSITVAPAQTLTDKEYQNLRDASLKIIREIGVDTGGSNIQFGVDPKTGRVVVIEMNPRVSRSSALASKATGFPIAKIAAKLSVGYTLDELKNDITRFTPASFEPAIDYVVTKVPRFAFEKFRGTDDVLTTQMKSVGEAMAMGRTFKESLQKALRSLEIGSDGFDEMPVVGKSKIEIRREILAKIKKPSSRRLWWVGEAMRRGFSLPEIHKATHIDPWFLTQIFEIISFEKNLRKLKAKKSKRSLNIAKDVLSAAKKIGFSDRRLAKILETNETVIRKLREKYSLRAVAKRVDTCAAEFEAHTPYFYSAYESENEAAPTKRKKIVILGGGPNRIGQGIEFDYCCCHASFSLQEEGYEVIMVNCNPETVSTDYDTSDRLYFEPLTFEDVTRILEEEKPEGIVVQFGGQTPLKLSGFLETWGAKILGTSSDAIDRVEDRKRFAEFIHELGLRQPENGLARSSEEAISIAKRIGYPIIVRPSYVLGGRAMEIVYEEAQLRRYLVEAVQASENRPVLIDRFLESATEVDVDALCDGKEVVVGGVMEHIEYAGVHSGDSACCLPPHTLAPQIISEITRQTRQMALALGVVGLMNVQFAVAGETVYVLEVNPRASRTVPFVAKATGIPLAKIAAKLMTGKTLAELGVRENLFPKHSSVKEAVFPFNKFPGVDTLLGPEMKSTGEVMGIDENFAMAFAKSQLAAGNALPAKGRAFISVRDADKVSALQVARELVSSGFEIIATQGTGDYFSRNDVNCRVVKKHYEGEPNILAPLSKNEVSLVVNTHEGSLAATDSYEIRRHALQYGVPYFTTIAAALAASNAIGELKTKTLGVMSLQDLARGW